MAMLQEMCDESAAVLSPVHIHSARVYYEDTDAAGVVYYANYLRFAERGRTEFLRVRGIDHQMCKEKHGFIFVIKTVNADYKSPARLDDAIDIETRAGKLGGASFDMHQVIRRGETILVTLSVRVVAVTPAGQVMRIPDALRSILEV